MVPTPPRTRVCDVAKSVTEPEVLLSHLGNEPETMVKLLRPCKPWCLPLWPMSSGGFDWTSAV